MSDTITVDMTRLYKLIEDMKPRQRASLVRSTMKATANKVKKRAFEILSSKVHVRNPKAMRNTIWTTVYKQVAGFRVTTAGNKHLYPSRMKNKRGEVREVPLGRWLEKGSNWRRTRARKPQSRGLLPAIKFLGQAREEMEPGIIREIETTMVKKLQRMAKKYE